MSLFTIITVTVTLNFQNKTIKKQYVYKKADLMLSTKAYYSAARTVLCETMHLDLPCCMSTTQ